MPKSTVFHSVVIRGRTFFASAHFMGAFIESDDDQVNIGPCEIIQYKEDGAMRYAIAKYGASSQIRISLSDLTQEEVQRLSIEFGIPMGSYTDTYKMFYKSPAFKGLKEWVKKHPRLAKRMSGKSPYIPDWYEMSLK